MTPEQRTMRAKKASTAAAAARKARKKHSPGNAMAKSKMSAKRREFFREEQGRKGGELSGAARMEKMTPEQRSAVAKGAAGAREAKRRKRRYALALPPPDVLRSRLQALAELEAFLIRRVCLDGEDPAELAKLFGKSEAEILRRVQAAIRKLNPEGPASEGLGG